MLIFLLFNILLGVLVWLCSCLIILSGGIEVNPGPKHSMSECFSICHWNLNSILAHNYCKLFLLKAYILVHKFYIICLPETYHLDSTIPLDDDNLAICNFITFYRSPSQSQDDFETSHNFEITLETLAQNGSFLTTIIGDFTAKSCNWYYHDKTSFEGSTIGSISSQF